MSQIVLDAEAFKALSSDTRLQILKALDARRLTVSELGRLLDLNKATVFEHLQQLAKADLVKKEDEGRKWVYYKLTWKGKNVLHPENVQFMLLLGTSVLSVGGLVAQFTRILSDWTTSSSSSELPTSPPGPNQPSMTPQAENMADAAAQEPTFRSSPATSSPPVTEPPASGGTPLAQTKSFDDLLVDPNAWLFVALLALLAAAAVFAWRYRVQRRRENAPILARIEKLGPPEPDEA